VPSETVDGNDVETVIDVMERAVARARGGGGPTVIEFMTYRWQGHFSGDPAAYRPAEEVAYWKDKDPIKLAREKLLSTHGVKPEEIDELHARVDEIIAAYLQFSLESPSPDPSYATAHVYTDIEVEAD